MIGARALTHEVTVRLRPQRPHERISVPPGYRAIVAIADTLDGPEEQPWLVPVRAAKLPDGRQGVRRELIRQYCYEEWTDATPKNRKQWFDRAEKALLKARRIDRTISASGEDFAVLPPPVDPASLF